MPSFVDLRNSPSEIRPNIKFEQQGEHSDSQNILARVAFEKNGFAPELHKGVPTLGVPMTTETEPGFQEVFAASGPVVAGREGNLVYAVDGRHLFCAVQVVERDIYRDAARIAYDSAFELATRLGYPNILRMWNLVGGIIDDNADGVEIYRDFCAGRSEAFALWSGRILHIPAATGIGTRGNGVYLYFISGRADAEVHHLENPRQTPAYHYPESYGPKSPSFARATFADGILYISGTASILGDETVHKGDISGQVDVTLENIATLISTENLGKVRPEGGYSLQDLDLIKVYVSRPEDIPYVRSRCKEVFSPDARVVYLNVDICRPDLLVEIEAIVQ
ncbi:FkbO/Hyg5 family chorismatase [Amycolatopsis azurea]|uniref:Endoribonuclease L-PSP n=1 Tax=Amycolatopsis azurea DSM 43854 TaxID=1238180 RepID=M2NPF3_9PSEU|nr:FkbO/Hyg5 family chorismatase [Amycolatopsis azurea]EMD24109.1 Endoribonuclease L-PSP [Amycolatopsis azurea DSM 43854]OOC05526.1 reactive intermediate/imine deaminase [Amycolatopsis azurea DSM 43854]